MITDSEKWHYLAVKSISASLRGIISNHVEDFYCLNCFHSYRTEKNLKKHEKVCNKHDYCYLEMPKEYNEILKYNHGEKLLKVPFIIYADLESLSEKSSTEKKAEHIPSGYSLFTSCSFDPTKNKHDCYRGKDYRAKFCKD